MSVSAISPLLASFRIVVLPTPDPDSENRYLAYVTYDKVGLHALPLDGNPHKSMALLAHPQGVSWCAVEMT